MPSIKCLCHERYYHGAYRDGISCRISSARAYLFMQINKVSEERCLELLCRAVVPLVKRSTRLQVASVRLRVSDPGTATSIDRGERGSLHVLRHGDHPSASRP